LTAFFIFIQLLEVRVNCPDLELIIVTGVVSNLPEGVVAYHEVLFQHGKLEFTIVNTKADDPALMIFTSGTEGMSSFSFIHRHCSLQFSGDPKGCLHAHRVLLGHVPGVEFPHNLFPQPLQDYYGFYTPADWAWIGMYIIRKIYCFFILWRCSQH
jgi:acetyl-CoA synthetase